MTGEEYKKPHKHVSLGLCRKQQGFSLFGHCCLLLLFILSLLLIVALMYWMVRIDTLNALINTCV